MDSRVRVQPLSTAPTALQLCQPPLSLLSLERPDTAPTALRPQEELLLPLPVTVRVVAAPAHSQCTCTRVICMRERGAAGRPARPGRTETLLVLPSTDDPSAMLCVLTRVRGYDGIQIDLLSC